MGFGGETRPQEGLQFWVLVGHPGSAQEPWEHLGLIKQQPRVFQGCPTGTGPARFKSLNPEKEKGEEEN